MIRLVVGGPDGQAELIEATIDTGFTGYLTLTPSLVALLALTRAGTEPARLADGGLVSLPIYRVRVEWDGEWRDVVAIATDNDPLIGMGLLDGFRLTLDVVDGGSVTIGRLP